jgi:adenylate cyclase
MVLRFGDAVAMAMRPQKGDRTLSNEVVCALQAEAERSGIPYLKIVGRDIVAATGFPQQNEGAAPLIADAALSIRDRCVALLQNSAHPQAFGIGLDCGVAIGGVVGDGPGVFNLWGEAPHAAEMMAASARPGTIQATEAAYKRLRQEFLFRPRGRFYLPRIGEAQTFVLAARL